MQGVLKHFRKKNDNEPTRVVFVFVSPCCTFSLRQQLIEIIYVHIITREEEAREGQKENKRDIYNRE